MNKRKGGGVLDVLPSEVALLVQIARCSFSGKGGTEGLLDKRELAHQRGKEV